MSKHSDTIKDWLVSNRLYEDNLFYYALIICFWFFWGFAFLGFEIDGYSQTQNLFFNFIWYLFICTMMALCPFWFKLFFGKTHTAKREQELNDSLSKLNHNDRQAIMDYLTQTGQLAMRPLQRWALVFLGSYFLFEVFFISAWVKEMKLVWQPDWVMVIAHWVRENTNLPPLNVERKLFMLDIGLSSDKILHTMYATETEFLDSEFGKLSLFFHFIRFISVPLIMLTMCCIFWDLMGWNGLNKFKDSTKIENKWQFLKSYLWVSFLAFFCVLIVWGGVLFMQSIRISAEMSMNIVMWLDNLYRNFSLILVIISFFIIYIWCRMTKKIIVSLIGLLN